MIFYFGYEVELVQLVEGNSESTGVSFIFCNSYACYLFELHR